MTTPLCRCRVLYLGCAVPKTTKDGLQGIQDPLKDIYPEGGASDASGIDAWLSAWSNGILLEYLDSMGLTISKFMPIETLHYCAAVRFVEATTISSSSSVSDVIAMRFFPLDSPQAVPSGPHHPPLFACIMRRTSGIKVLECHGFICKNELAANALVKACFHAYSDSMNLRLYTDVVPQLVPVVIPKKKSIFKMGKKSRSRSIESRAIIPIPVNGRPGQLVAVPHSAASSVNLDPYLYPQPRPSYSDWRSPTPTPVYLRTTTPLFKPVSNGDYRYVNTAMLSPANGLHRDNTKGKQRLWSGSASTTGSDREYYIYGNMKSPQPSISKPMYSRVSSRGSRHTDDEFFLDEARQSRATRVKSPVSSEYTSTSFSPAMTSSHLPREQYYEATTFERRKDGKNGLAKAKKVEQEHVEYSRQQRSNTNKVPAAPYMSELERTLSNGQHLPADRKISSFKRYESMPELSHHSVVHKQGARELPGMMNGLHLQGSSGSGDRTPDTTPTSTPAGSLSEYYRERNGRVESPIIPEADYNR